MHTSIIHTKGLSKEYSHQKAVDDLGFHVEEGEIFGFLGPNGAGKTTTLLMLMGLSQPSEGFALVCGMDPSRNPVEIKKSWGTCLKTWDFTMT